MDSKIARHDRVALLGAAGLVGQNLAVLLEEHGYADLLAVDKHAGNVARLRELHPCMSILHEDLAAPGRWEEALAGTRALVMLQAQIGGEIEAEFRRNTVESTKRVLAACRRHRVPYIVHVSSSVVQSRAHDWYTETKKEQERLVVESGIPFVVLRPTLMFGWFDRKHLGWLSRFMHKAPFFPVPGSGRYLRQPLYVLDFCRILLACLERQPQNQLYDITGRERIDYIDMIHAVREASRLKTPIVRIPYALFWLALKAYGLLDRNPPFTTRQLEALVTPDEFALIPWWEIFGVPATPFTDAVRETFRSGPYADVVLEF